MTDLLKIRIGCAVIAGLCLWAAPALAKVGHVIHVSVDGLRGDLLAGLVATSPEFYPTFSRFVTEGATTFNARTDVFSVETLPNHATILTGRPVARPAGAPATVYHGFMDNSDPGTTGTLHTLGNPNLSYIASTFDVAHDHGLSTAFYTEKDKFNLFDRSYDENNGALDTVGVDDGRDKIDLFTYDLFDFAPFLASLTEHRFNYSFVHFNATDGWGHNAGWGSPEWNAAVQYVDSTLGLVLAAVQADQHFANDTAIIVTADHGGEGKGHDSITAPADYTIPLLVWGKGVAAGADLYGLNMATRLDPGTSQPSYTAPIQPIRNGDTANLAMQLLGLPPVPGSSINAAQDLAVRVVPEMPSFVLVCLGLPWWGRRLPTSKF